MGYFVALVTVILAAIASRALAGDVVIDCGKEVGTICAINGVNAGPLDGGGGTLDLTAHHRALRIPLTRLHDCNWPNPDVVDMHVVFPNPAADPTLPESYDFVRTDAYIKAIRDAGGNVVYRLGESIEHGPDRRRQRPPADYDRWAQACIGVIRHYNEGWAGGFKYDIRHWEIWNEPDNRPNCWTGTDDDYFRLYVTAAKAIKARFPDLMVGGPAVGNTGQVEAGVFKPSKFSTAFIERCKRDAAPLDFFSWHIYTPDSSAVVTQVRGVREMLNRSGFEKTQSHLNEWNYLPDNDWGPMLVKGQGAPRERFYDRVGGVEGAAFAAATLALLQDEPVDMANYFSANTLGFGLFNAHGVPKKSFCAFRAFAMMLDTPVKLSANGKGGRTAVLAGKANDASELRVLVASPSSGDGAITVVFDNPTWTEATYEELRIDPEHDLSVYRAGRLKPGERRIELSFKPPAVALLKLRPAQ